MQHSELVEIHYKIVYEDQRIHVQVKNEDFALNHKQQLKSNEKFSFTRRLIEDYQDVMENFLVHLELSNEVFEINLVYYVD